MEIPAISNISHGIINTQEINNSKTVAVKNKPSDDKSPKLKSSEDIFNVKVLELLDSILSTEELKTNHPLSSANFQMLDNFSDATKELDYFRTDEFKHTAGNLFLDFNMDNVKSLFLE